MEHFDSGNRKNGFDRDWHFIADLPHDWLIGQEFDADGLNAQGFFRRGYA